MVTDEQVRLLRKKMTEGKTMATAAAAAGMSERSAYTWKQGGLPSETKTPRGWRTRPDPLAAIWESDVVPLLVADEGGVLEGTTILAEGTLAMVVASVRPPRRAAGVGERKSPRLFQRSIVMSTIQRAHGDLSPASNLLFRAWVLARGLGYRSHNQAQLLAYGFEAVYLAALESRSLDDAWRYLNDRLPNSSYWSDWEPPRRLRTGVLNAFVGRDLDPSLFGYLLASETLFEELTSEARWMSGGRGYLRRVKRALRESDPNRFSARIANLDRLL